MPVDPVEAQRLRDLLVDVRAIRYAAAARAAHPPRLEPEDWRGPAFRVYERAADELAHELRRFADELIAVEAAVRTELAHVVA